MKRANKTALTVVLVLAVAAFLGHRVYRFFCPRLDWWGGGARSR